MGPDDFSFAPQQLPEQAQTQAPPRPGFLTPEQANALLALSADPERKALLEKRIAQAQALRNRQSAPHTTGLGAALGGIGDIGRDIGSMLQEKAAQEKYENLLNQEVPLRQQYARALLAAQGMGDDPAGTLGGGQ